MSLSTPKCPTGGEVLVLTHHGDLDSWVCTESHGLALTVTESYERLQEDEISLLWERVRAGQSGSSSLRCPMCEQGMVGVELGYDDDEVPEGEAGDGADLGTVHLDVCEPCQVIWFDNGELDLLPMDQPDAEPTAEEVQAVAEIRESFGQSLVAGVQAREAATLTDKIYRRFFKRGDIFHRATGFMTSSR